MISTKAFAKELGIQRQDFSAYLHTYESLVSKIPKNNGGRQLTPEIKTFFARAHQIVMLERVSVRDAMQRLLKLQRSSDLKALAGAVERSSGLKEVVSELDAARGAAERLRQTTRVVRVEELQTIEIALQAVAEQLEVQRKQLVRDRWLFGGLGALLVGLVVLVLR
jgi:hypothetical protein